MLIYTNNSVQCPFHLRIDEVILEFSLGSVMWLEICTVTILKGQLNVIHFKGGILKINQLSPAEMILR